MFETRQRRPTSVTGDPRRESPRTGANSAEVLGRTTRIEQLQARARQLTSSARGVCRVASPARGDALSRLSASSRSVSFRILAHGRRRARIWRVAAGLAQPLHASRVRWLPHQGRGVRAEPLPWRAARADIARPQLAARRRQRQRHALHVHGGVLRRALGAEPRQPEDLVRRPYRVAGRRGPGAAVHGAVQHHGQQRRHREVTGRRREGGLRTLRPGAVAHLCTG